MRCPKCGATKSSVVDIDKPKKEIPYVEDVSDECQHRFTTYERVEERTLVVVKKKTVRESSFREIKSLMGLSAQPRSVLCQVMKSTWWSIDRAKKLRSRSENEIQSEYIGSLVMEELAELDEITYVRFASVYRSFKDVSELESLLQQITQSSKKKKGKIDETK